MPRSSSGIPPIALGFGPSSYSSVSGAPGFFRQLTIRWLEAGGRHLDTALKYNNLDEIGEGLADALSAGKVGTRSEIFVTCKIYPSQLLNESSVAAKLLAPLRLEYVDLLMLHIPGAFHP